MIWSDLHGDVESQAEMIWPLRRAVRSVGGVTTMNGPKVAVSQPPRAARCVVHLAICWNV